MANMFAGWQEGTSTAVNTGLWLVIIFGILGIIFFIIWYKKYNKVVIIRKIVHNRKKIIHDKCRYLKDKDGNELWKFLHLRKEVKIPPAEAIELTQKGAEFAECYLLETGEISWILDKNDTIESFIQFTTEDRQFLINQYRKAKLEGGVNWKDLIIPIFGIVALVIITVSLMIFYKDMGEPLLEMGGTLASFQQKQIEMMDKMNVMLERLCSSGYNNCTQVISSGTNTPVKIP